MAENNNKTIMEVGAMPMTHTITVTMPKPGDYFPITVCMLGDMKLEYRVYTNSAAYLYINNVNIKDNRGTLGVLAGIAEWLRLPLEIDVHTTYSVKA